VLLHTQQAASGCLTFQPGEAVKYITVQVLDNGVREPDVTFRVVLTRVSPHTASGGGAGVFFVFVYFQCL
jgi:hypothetical protein